MKKYIPALAIFLVLAFTTYVLMTDTKTPSDDTTDTTAVTDVDTSSETSTGELPSRATIQTNLGDIVLQLHPDKTPKTVENFTTLAKQGKYDDTIFHRVIKSFMIQGGDYTNRDGTGGQSMWGELFDDEIDPNLKHVRGVISMANRGLDANGNGTNGSQFFITQVDTPHLNGRHTVFGQVVEGIDIVDKIAEVKTDLSNRPAEEVVVKTILVE